MTFFHCFLKQFNFPISSTALIFFGKISKDKLIERIGKNYSIHTNLPYAEPVLTGNNMPKSWKGRWRSAENKYQKNYIPIQVAKDIQGMIRVNAMRIGKTS